MPQTSKWFNAAPMGLSVLLLFGSGVSWASPLETYLERGFMAEAGPRCRLFGPAVQSALIAGREQARGAALRAGFSARDVQRVAERSKARALSIPCDSPDLVAAARRVSSSFEAYSRLVRQDFPGDRLGWKADRSESRQRVTWRLTQDLDQAGAKVRFGIAGRNGADSLMVVAALPGGGAPYAARIVMRDRRLTVGAYIDARGESLRTLPLQRRLPRQGPFESFAAQARSAAGADLLPAGVKSGWAFRFPLNAAAAIAELDPREAIMIEFLLGAGPPQRVYLEVGDFAAARAFLAIP